jgi:hypothetical protein
MKAGTRHLRLAGHIFVLQNVQMWLIHWEITFIAQHK